MKLYVNDRGTEGIAARHQGVNIALDSEAIGRIYDSAAGQPERGKETYPPLALHLATSIRRPIPVVLAR